MRNLCVSNDNLKNSLSQMILSASGWRKVFSNDGEAESFSDKISDEDIILCTAIAKVFFEEICLDSHSRVLMARDARPTGKIICETIGKVLKYLGADVCYAGICAAPEIMAQSVYGKYSGLVYVSASHNPVGHNGIKFGNNGGVFGQSVINPMIERLTETVEDADLLCRLYNNCCDTGVCEDENLKKECLANYRDFIMKTSFPDGQSIKLSGSIGIVADMNGSARSKSIDEEFFRELGIKVSIINKNEIVHAIVPEGKNLNTCKEFLEKKHAEDPSFVIGYVPDNDGDRGNIVYINNKGNAEIVSAQELFALCVFSTLKFYNELGMKNIAIAVNGPTSLRVDEICSQFGTSVFRSEVGEANTVNLADKLREQGYTVPILGEGSNGGNITYPARVRDPMNTIMCIVRLLVSGKTMEDSLKALPRFITSDSFDEEAVLHLKTKEFQRLKTLYEDNFKAEWDKMKSTLAQFDICSYSEFQTDGTNEVCKTGNCTKTGGLKILFKNRNNESIAFIWMRPSGTEPLLRISADVKGNSQELYDILLDWQRQMVLRAADLI